MTFFYANPTVRESPQYLPTHPSNRKRPATSIMAGAQWWGVSMGIKGESHLATSPYPHGHGWAGQILFSRSELSYGEFLARNIAEFELERLWNVMIPIYFVPTSPFQTGCILTHIIYLVHHWTLQKIASWPKVQGALKNTKMFHKKGDSYRDILYINYKTL